MTTPKMAAIRAVFAAMFDAVDVAGDFDEGKWEDMIGAFNATGRFVFGWPHLESREEDMFGALDDIATQLEAAKSAITEVGTEARIVLHQLHEALDPLTPEDETPRPDQPGGSFHPDEEPPAESHAHTPPPEPVVEHESVEEPPAPFDLEQTVRTLIDTPPPEPDRALLDRARALSPVDRLGLSEPGGAQTPSAQDEAMFAAIRADPTTTLAAAEQAAGLAHSRGGQRMKLLDSYGTLPADIKEWRATLRRGGRRARPVYHPDPTAEPEPEPTDVMTFEERRKESAREASERTWRQRHPETA